MKKKFPVIENICPINGVTPEQLYNYCQYLFARIEGNEKLNEHDKLTAIGNTVLTTYNKMKAGDVPKFIFEDFKGYLFVSLKNQILAYFQLQKTRSNKIFDNFEEVENIQPPTIHNYFTSSLDFQVFIKSLSKTQKKITDFLLAGYRQKDIVKELQVNKHYVSNVVARIKEKFALIYDIQIKCIKYKKRNGASNFSSE